ncbi:MAG: tRNA (N(6)-L-threonylcarbamoyladenosine(37)-C(2))-methylthiotransferase MtaB [Alphaproteobacteria bacterium]|nr:tRNA (N(6)-L-threonylcarbamoyladenosine(37)-C(2))-methylthiotransferase MtaB [Alphaproteobacteria bacterium]
MPIRVETFGCRLNTFESASISEFSDVEDDIIVVNTCAVTGEAERQCRQTIRKIRRENPNSLIFVVGCAAQVHPEIYAQMPEVDRVLGNREKLNKDNYKINSGVDVSSWDKEVKVNLSEPVFFDDKVRAFIQIQQGCNNHCTYCIIRQARGPASFLEENKILSYASKLVDKGFKEICLTGVDITEYPRLGALVNKVSKIDGLKRLRLGSIDPAMVDDELINVFANNDIVQPHIHFSAQSGDDVVLKRMARRHKRKDIIDLCKKFRLVRPDMVFGADFITGFPTETDEMFQNTVDLVKESKITHLHVFPYSERSGTPAIKLPQVPVEIRKNRARILREAGEEQMNLWMMSKIGQSMSVLVEKENSGLCEYYTQVNFDQKCKVGSFVNVKIKDVKDAVFVAEIAKF